MNYEFDPISEEPKPKSEHQPEEEFQAETECPEESEQQANSEDQQEPEYQADAEYQEEPMYRDEPVYQPEPAYTPQPQKKKSSAGKVIALALVCSLIGGVTGAGIVSLQKDLQQVPQKSDTALVGQRENIVLDIVKIDTSKLMTAAEVYAANVNSTVGITTSIVTTNYWGQQTASAASGSGFIITESGYILTNYHVVEKSTFIAVTLYDGRSLEAKLVNYDQNNDIAVLKIEAENLSPVVIGNSANMNVGDSVIAIGNPLGELTFSLTAGTVSALNRDVTMSNGLNMTLIQTDCAINSGNSGGALFNLYGEVIGITNAKYSTSSSSEASIDNIGFAIPMNDVWNLVESIIEKGYVSKPYVGVSAVDVSEDMQNFGLPKGAALQSVVEGSPAAEAGLKRNDIITKIDDTEITCASDLSKFVKACTVGQELKVTVYRQGTILEITVIVGEQVQNQVQNSSSQSQSNQSSQDYYFPFFP